MTVRASYTVSRGTNKITGVKLEVLEEPPLLDGPVVQTARAAMIRERAMKAIVVGMHRAAQFIDGPPTAQRAEQLQATAIQLARQLATHTSAAWWIVHGVKVMNPTLALDTILNSD
jgi:hypothetical protein